MYIEEIIYRGVSSHKMHLTGMKDNSGHKQMQRAQSGMSSIVRCKRLGSNSTEYPILQRVGTEYPMPPWK